MRILFIAPRYHINLHFRIKALKDTGHEVVFLSQYKGVSERYDVIEPKVVGFSNVYLFLEKIRKDIFRKNPSDFWKLNLAWPNTIKLRKEIKEFKPDIVIVKGMKNSLSLVSLCLARKYKIRSFFLLQVKNYYADTIIKKVLLFFIKKVLKVEGIISEIDNQNKNKDNFYHYIPFAIEVKEFEKKFFKNGKINLISIGKFVERKAHLDLLRVINELKNRSNLFLTIIGEASNPAVLKKIEEYIRENKLEDLVELKFNLSNKQVLEILKNYDIFVLPSYNEPASYSVLEAMANKLPVICSDTCGTRCYIKDGENGLVFKSRDDNDLAEKIEAIIKDKDKLKKMGDKSFEIVKKNHSLKLFSEEVEKLVR